MSTSKKGADPFHRFDDYVVREAAGQTPLLGRQRRVIVTRTTTLTEHTFDRNMVAYFCALDDEPAIVVLDNAETPWNSEPARFEELIERVAHHTRATLVAMRTTVHPPRPQWHDVVPVDRLDPESCRQLFRQVSRVDLGDPEIDDLIAPLDGLPLAIELLAVVAAAEANASTLRERWMVERLALLDRRGAMPDRLTSVIASVALSFDTPLLDEAAQTLASTIAQLPGGMDPRHVADDCPGARADSAARLRQSGLLIDRNERLDMLAPIREAIAFRTPMNVTDRAELASRFATRIEMLSQRLGSVGGAAAGDDLRREYPNIAAAVGWAITDGRLPIALALATANARLARYRGLSTSTGLDQVVEAARNNADHEMLATALAEDARTQFARSNNDRARELFEQALPLYQALGDQLGEANCYSNLGKLEFLESNNDRARELFEQALPLYQALGSQLGEANCYSNLGELEFLESNNDRARELFEQALPLYQAIRHRPGEEAIAQLLNLIA